MRTVITIAERMYQMGWDDAVNGNSPKFSTKNYMDGYRQGKDDTGDED